jgi:hypothetical protein
VHVGLVQAQMRSSKQLTPFPKAPAADPQQLRVSAPVVTAPEAKVTEVRARPGVLARTPEVGACPHGIRAFVAIGTACGKYQTAMAVGVRVVVVL